MRRKEKNGLLLTPPLICHRVTSVRFSPKTQESREHNERKFRNGFHKSVCVCVCVYKSDVALFRTAFRDVTKKNRLFSCHFATVQRRLLVILLLLPRREPDKTRVCASALPTGKFYPCLSLSLSPLHLPSRLFIFLPTETHSRQRASYRAPPRCKKYEGRQNTGQDNVVHLPFLRALAAIHLFFTPFLIVVSTTATPLTTIPLAAYSISSCICVFLLLLLLFLPVFTLFTESHACFILTLVRV